ncbi:hypothetical protein Tco_0322225 [Tanacetum coccineum]
MVTLVDGVLAKGVVMIFEMDIAFYAIQRTEILSLMIRLRILSIILPISHTHLHNPNTYSDFDQIEPPQFPIIHQLPQEMSIQYMEDLKQQYLDEMKTLFNGKDYRNGKIDIEIKINELKENFNGMSIEINKKKQIQQLEQVANLNTYPSRHFNSLCYDDDDDDDDEEYTIAITPDLQTEEPDNSLSMGDEHLDTIPETESDELIKFSDENLVPILSESKDFFRYQNDDESSHEEVIHEISFKTYSNPLFDLDEEIISSEFNLIHNEDVDSTSKNDHFNTESSLWESLLNRDTLMASSPKIDSLLDEFAGKLITIPPRIVNREYEEYISLLERLLYDNSSPRPPEDFHANPNTIIESLPTFPIPVEDSDSLREEIDIFPGPDDSIPPGIKSDNYDSEGDDNSTSFPEFESFHVDYPDLGDSTIDVVEDIPVDMPNILPTHPTLHMDFDFIPTHNDLGSNLDVSSPSGDRNKIYDLGICIEVESTRFLATHSPVIDTLLPFSSKNEDKAFNHGVLDSKEKSPPSSSHWGFKASKLFHHKSPMLIHGDNTPNLGVRHPYFYPLTKLQVWGIGSSVMTLNKQHLGATHAYPNIILVVVMNKIARIFEVSHGRGFCPSFTRASHPQLHLANPISKSYRLTLSLSILNKRLGFT